MGKQDDELAVTKHLKIFVGGLPEGVREQEVGNHFAKYGNITQANVFLPQRGDDKKAPYAFATYKFAADADAAVVDPQHFPGVQRPLNMGFAAPKGKDKRQRHEDFPQDADACKVFVGGITDRDSEEQVGDFFSQWGLVILVYRDHQWGFVVFATREAAMRLLDEGAVMFQRRRLDIRASDSRKNMDEEERRELISRAIARHFHKKNAPPPPVHPGGGYPPPPGHPGGYAPPGYYPPAGAPHGAPPPDYYGAPPGPGGAPPGYPPPGYPPPGHAPPGYPPYSPHGPPPGGAPPPHGAPPGHHPPPGHHGAPHSGGGPPGPEYGEPQRALPAPERHQPPPGNDPYAGHYARDPYARHPDGGSPHSGAPPAPSTHADYYRDSRRDDRDERDGGSAKGGYYREAAPDSHGRPSHSYAPSSDPYYGAHAPPPGNAHGGGGHDPRYRPY